MFSYGQGEASQNLLYNAGLQSDKTNLTRLVDYIETDEDMWVVTELAEGKKLPDLLV